MSDKEIRGLRAKCNFYDDFITDSVELEKIIDVLSHVPEEYLVSIEEIALALKKSGDTVNHEPSVQQMAYM